MTNPAADVWSLARRVFRQRTEAWCEQYADEADRDGSDTTDWSSVITHEAFVLALRGPAGYLDFVAELEANVQRPSRLRLVGAGPGVNPDATPTP
jgi:hypothetical protein